MVTAQDWSSAYARQARADMRARAVLLGDATLPVCQQLHFLQMACEKLCKAHLCISGSRPDDLQRSHGYTDSVLPIVFRTRLSQKFDRELKAKSWLLQRVGHLAREINFLAPAVDDGGRRPDNCEYPWREGDTLVVPAEKQFTNLDFLKAQGGTLFIKLVDVAIEDLCSPPPPPPGDAKS